MERGERRSHEVIYEKGEDISTIPMEKTEELNMGKIRLARANRCASETHVSKESGCGD